MKAIKLLLLAAVLIGALVCLLWPEPEIKVPQPSLKSERAKMWKDKIDKLCTDAAWASEAYTNIENGIHTDWKTSSGTLISMDEELSLQKYLFASACSYINSAADKHFKLTAYSDGKIRVLEDAVAMLQGKSRVRGTDSNLSAAAALIAAYRQVLRLLVFSSGASYSHPLKAFNGNGAAARKASIERMAAYKSHFHNNTSIKQKMARLGNQAKGAEGRYYDQLERAIEQHYRSSGDLTRLLDDQIRFEDISTNSSAVRRLESFITSQN